LSTWAEGEEIIAMRENSGKPWTVQEDEQLRELAASGAALAEIAEKLSRTTSATKARAYSLGPDLPKRTHGSRINPQRRYQA